MTKENKMFQALSSYGLVSSAYLPLLKRLSQDDTVATPTELSRLLRVTPAGVSALLDKLEKQKLIKRRQSKTDRRSNLITLTPKGQDLWNEIATAKDDD